MPRKTTILIIILAIVTLGLLFMALRTSSPTINYTTTTPTGNATKNIKKTSKLFFAPSALDASSASSVDVMLDSDESEITGVDLVLSFDPKVITSFTVAAPTGENTFFGANPTILTNNVDLQNGKAQFTIAIPLTSTPKSGNGKVARVNFTVNRASTLKSTQIEFLNTTKVVAHGEPESVLGETTPLTIQLKP